MFNLPLKVQYILNTFSQAGYEAYIVGGCVRDLLLGITPKDWDITTNCLPLGTEELFPNTIPTGIKHGTVTVMLDGEGFEVTTFRTEGDYLDNRHPSNVTFVSDIKEDLSRRDFTVNALAYNPMLGLKDFFYGKDDLKNKLIRSVGDGSKRFKEDALRMIRAIRFSSTLGFNIEEDTLLAIKRNNNLISNVSNERIREELCKILLSKKPSVGINLLHKCGLLKFIIPHIYVSFDEVIFKDLLKLIDSTEEDLILRLTALFYNANIFSNNSDDSYISNYNICNSTLKALKFSNNTVESCSLIIRESHNLISFTSKVKIKKFLSSQSLSLLNHMISFEKSKALSLSLDNKENMLSSISSIEVSLRKILNNNEPIYLKDLSITGNDLMTLGIEKGKNIGIILNLLLNKVLEDPSLNKKEILYDIVKSLY